LLNFVLKSSKGAAHRHGSQLEQLQRRVEKLQTQWSKLDAKLEKAIEQFKSSEFSKLRRQVVLEKLIEALIEVNDFI
jgi:predicted RNase H-like nuclease (RuvC/YqgF family)